MLAEQRCRYAGSSSRWPSAFHAAAGPTAGAGTRGRPVRHAGRPKWKTRPTGPRELRSRLADARAGRPVPGGRTPSVPLLVGPAVAVIEPLARAGLRPTPRPETLWRGVILSRVRAAPSGEPLGRPAYAQHEAPHRQRYRRQDPRAAHRRPRARPVEEDRQRTRRLHGRLGRVPAPLGGRHALLGHALLRGAGRPRARPDVELLETTSGEWLPLAYQNGRTYRRAAVVEGDKLKVARGELASLVSFVNTWMRNIKEQQAL